MKSFKDIYEQTHVIDAMFSCEAANFDEEIKDAKWVQAMNEEIDAIEKNQTWDLVDISIDKTNIGVKWAYKNKLNEK